MNELTLIIKHDEDDVEAAEVFVDGEVGDHEYRFLLDTGAARSSVMFDQHTSQLESVEMTESSGLFAGSSDDLVTVPSIEVGPISKQNFTLVRAAEHFPGARNLIGMDLLKDWCCHFHFDEQRVSVTANNELSAGFAFQELMLDTRFHPYVEVHCGTGNFKAVWDTGAGLTIVDMTVIRNQPSCFHEVGESIGTDSTGAEMRTPMFIVSAISIGNQVFPPHRVAGVDLEYVNSTIEVSMDMILGYSTLSKANWLFDFPHKRWAITKRLGDR